MKNSFYQIKAIRKNTKPPMWRRAFIPANITFSQLAVVLEELLEIDRTEMFEFEFYQKGLRLIRWNESWMEPNYRFSYADATENFINELLHDEDWFTFRIIDSHIDAPEYRVEIEQERRGILYKNQELNHPCMIKWKVNPNDRYWSKGDGINAIFEQNYQMHFESKVYASFEKTLNQLEKHGLIVSENPESKRDNYKESPEEALGRLAREINTMLDNTMEKYEKEHGENSIPLPKDEIYGEIANSVQEATSETKKRFNRAVKEKMKELPPDIYSMEEILSFYNKEDILNIGDAVGARLDTSKSKKKLAYDLSRFLLDADTMRRIVYGVPAVSLDYLEKVIEQDYIYNPSAEDELLAEGLLSYNYLYEAKRNTDKSSSFCIPKDVAVVYQIIKNNGYRQTHEKIRWMISCLGIVNRYYGVITTDALYKVYKQKKHLSGGYEDFIKIYDTVPETLKASSIKNDKVIGNQFLEDGLYKNLSKIQRNVDYYIPSVKEIEALERDMFPSDKKEYRELFDFYVNWMNYDYYKARVLTVKAFAVISAGGMLSDYMKEIEENNVIFDSDKDASEFTNIYARMNNVTPMLEFKGHCPNDMTKLNQSNASNIIPFSSAMLDLPFGNNTSVHAPKKVYPNDSCPCGSGKKYKKCCGRLKS
ncbi:MAG: SEC-C domain-containing protein [Pseudobutyrivibrio sp.]|nr:SEC-C domain-containing protein [Pseudobutyrivibrio sp.]